MESLNLGQDVANKRERDKIISCSYSGQIFFPITSYKNASLQFSY